MSLHHVDFVDGIADAVFTEKKYLCIHKGTDLIQYGEHKGQVTSGDTELDIEWFDNEEELIAHFEEEGIELPEEYQNDDA